MTLWTSCYGVVGHAATTVGHAAAAVGHADTAAVHAATAVVHAATAVGHAASRALLACCYTLLHAATLSLAVHLSAVAVPKMLLKCCPATELPAMMQQEVCCLKKAKQTQYGHDAALRRLKNPDPKTVWS
jgi:replication-associated recombination protein RarA